MAGGVRNDDDEVISGINVTPLVDVVLVLLIIFIVTASSLLRSSIPIELPYAASAEESKAGLMIVDIDEDGQLYINARLAELANIPEEVALAKKKLADARRRGETQQRELNVFVSADVSSNYGRFAQVVDHLRLAGVVEISMDTRPAPANKKEESAP